MAASLTSGLGIRSRNSSRLNCLLLLLDVAIDRTAVAAVRPMTFGTNVCPESPRNCFISTASTSIPGICSFRNSTTRVSSSGIPSATKSRRSRAARRLVSTSCQNSSASGSSSVCNSSAKTLFESCPAEVCVLQILGECRRRSRYGGRGRSQHSPTSGRRWRGGFPNSPSV